MIHYYCDKCGDHIIGKEKNKMYVMRCHPIHEEMISKPVFELCYPCYLDVCKYINTLPKIKNENR